MSSESNTTPRLPPNRTMLTQTYHSTLETGELHGVRVVIKRSRRSEEPRVRERFHAEVAGLKAAVGHNHITQLLAEDESTLSLTLRAEPGQSLDHYVDGSQMCTLLREDGACILTQMASALAFLHEHHVLHDDVKPDNIMYRPSPPHSVLIDFGAAVVDPRSDYFNSSGTPNYAPPEYLLRRKGTPGDVWALGVTMLFLDHRVALPDGEWILPVALEEPESTARHEMSAWLIQVDSIRVALVHSLSGNPDDEEGSDHLESMVAAMLHPDPAERIHAGELHNQVSKRSIGAAAISGSPSGP